MPYAVKELFYTLQGEGYQVGRPSIFLRFAGCNLWSGREADRGKGPGGCSSWCDSFFVGTDGDGGGKFQTAEDLARAIEAAWPGGATSNRFVVCTGGEPLLQLDEALVHAFHALGFEIAVETNGTQMPPKGLDWCCVSPKAGAPIVLKTGNELKFVYPQVGLDPTAFEGLEFDHFFLQPRDGPEQAEHIQQAVRYCLEHPHWRLSLQTHKFIGIR